MDTPTFPTLFVSHGAPTFALEPGAAGVALRAFAEALPKPRAVLLLSPHWMTDGLRLTGAASPRTIHDFGGFPAPLYALQYPAPGAAWLAERVQALLARAGLPAGIDATRGFDHGAWVPMRHLYPDADVPMVQLAMPATLSLLDGATLGAALRPLRFEGVLVIGSGSLTHNLHEIDPSAGDAAAPQARSFVEAVSAGLDPDAATGVNVDADVDASLAFAHTLAALPGLTRAHPTLEHLAPLPFARAAAGADARAIRLEGGYRYGALSMHSFVFA